jgi:hypothetical protein
MASVWMIAAAATSAGGVTAAVVKKLRTRKGPKKLVPTGATKGARDGSTESSLEG